MKIIIVLVVVLIVVVGLICVALAILGEAVDRGQEAFKDHWNPEG